MVSNASVLARKRTFHPLFAQSCLCSSRGEFMSVLALAASWTCLTALLRNLLAMKDRPGKKRQDWLLTWRLPQVQQASSKSITLTFLVFQLSLVGMAFVVFLLTYPVLAMEPWSYQQHSTRLVATRKKWKRWTLSGQNSLNNNLRLFKPMRRWGLMPHYLARLMIVVSLMNPVLLPGQSQTQFVSRTRGHH